MRSSHAFAVFIAALFVAACVATEDVPTDDGTWVGTITTEGNVTTVINESGSVWGGTATLVEEASIGVEAGDEAYMFGDIADVYATDDRIYVLDQGASALRVYDFAGNHLRSFGGEGQGPGEVSAMVWDLAVSGEGLVYVADPGNRRVNIYSADGESLDEIPLSGQVSFGGGYRPVLADGGGIWVRVRLTDADGQSARAGVRVYTVDGPAGEPIEVPQIEYEPRFLRVDGRDIENVPFAPNSTWTIAPDGSLIAGASDRYRFRIVHPDGTSTIVERFWDPVQVTPEESDYWRRLTLAQFPPTMDVSWDGENIPDHKPAYFRFGPAATGEIWVLRQGPLPPDACGVPPEEMLASFDPAVYALCIFGDMIVDVFDRDGRYLGDVEGIALVVDALPFVRGDTVVAVVQDEAGTIMVKRYRLVLPGEQ